MSNDKFSDKDLAGLSDAEREAIAGDDENDTIDQPVDVDGGDAEPGTADATPGVVAETAGGTETVAAIDAPAAEADPSTPAAKTEAVDIAAGDRDAPFTPAYRIDGPKDFNAAHDALRSELKALNDKFTEGDLSVQELLEEQGKVNDKIADLREHQFAAKLASELNKQGGEQRWKMEQEDFFEANKQYAENGILRAALNAAVIDIANREENASRSGKWVLAEAHKAVQESIGVVVAPSVPAVEKPAKPAVNRKPDLSGVPKTLANLPAADIQATGSDEFAALDKLQGVELEQALAKLTPAQEDRYLRANG